MIAVHRSVREAGTTPTPQCPQFGRDGASA
jgi:hypothetical protein